MMHAIPCKYYYCMYSWTFNCSVSVYPPLPETMTNDDLKREQIQFLIDNRVNPIEGLTSNYDYEKNEWKWDKK